MKTICVFLFILFILFPFAAHGKGRSGGFRSRGRSRGGFWGSKGVSSSSGSGGDHGNGWVGIGKLGCKEKYDVTCKKEGDAVCDDQRGLKRRHRCCKDFGAGGVRSFGIRSCTPREEHTYMYEYLGCFEDFKGPSRIFKHHLDHDVELTNTKCRDSCRQAGFPYAGTQYRHYCFCGTEIEYQKIKDNKKDDKECQSSCPGWRKIFYSNLVDTNEDNKMCGGAWRMRISKSKDSRNPCSKKGNDPDKCLPVPRVECCFYEHDNFNGYKHCYGPGDYASLPPINGQVADDRYTSFTCDPEIRVIGFDSINFANQNFLGTCGASIEGLQHRSPDVNDKWSSLKIEFCGSSGSAATAILGEEEIASTNDKVSGPGSISKILMLQPQGADNYSMISIATLIISIATFLLAFVLAFVLAFRS